jgi:hypothetical protein
MADRGATGSFCTFEPATAIGRENTYTELTSQEPVEQIVLPCNTYGVQVGPDLLGHVEKLKYSYHDISGETKFS